MCVKIHCRHGRHITRDMVVSAWSHLCGTQYWEKRSRIYLGRGDTKKRTQHSRPPTCTFSSHKVPACGVICVADRPRKPQPPSCCTCLHTFNKQCPLCLKLLSYFLAPIPNDLPSPVVACGNSCFLLMVIHLSYLTTTYKICMPQTITYMYTTKICPRCILYSSFVAFCI